MMNATVSQESDSAKKRAPGQIDPPYRDPKSETPQKQIDKLTKHFYILIGVIVLIVGAVTIAFTSTADDSPRSSFGSYDILGVLLLAAWSQLHRDFWQMVQGSGARTTPFKAVFFSIIPIYNIYWIFVSFCGLYSDFNKLINSQRPSDRLPVKTFGVSLPVLTSISIIFQYCFLLSLIEPRLAILFDLIGSLFFVINMVLFPIYYYKLLKAAKNIILTGPQWEGTIEPPKPWEDETQSETKIVTPPQPKRYDPSMIGKKAPGK